VALIAVNGTPLQPAIDAAQPGDVIVPKAGGYAGRLKITKSVSIKGDGAVVIDGGTGDGSHTVNIDVGVRPDGVRVGAKNVVLSGLDLRHGSFAVRFQGDCTGSIAEHNVIPVVDWMYRNTNISDTGGNAFVFEKAQGVEVRYNQIRKCRANSAQYVVDGGPFEFFSAQKINVHHNEVWDCVNSGEFGKNTADPNNSEIRIEDNIFHGRANPLTATSDLKLLANGILVRALSNSSIQRNVFDLVDYWSLNFDIGGTYGSGGFSGITVKGNTFRLIPGSNRMVHVEAGIPLSAFAAFDENKVYTTSTSARVAEIGTTRYYPGDLAKFRTDTGWEKNSTWTVGALPPVPTITPPAIDPCAAITAQNVQLAADLLAARAERDAAASSLALANSTIASLTTERDDLALKVEAAAAILAS
jgi:hypothetical protein